MSRLLRISLAAIAVSVALPVYAQTVTITTAGGDYGNAMKEAMWAPAAKELGYDVREETQSDGLAAVKMQVEARGGGRGHVLLRVQPTNVVRLLQPPGAATWSIVARRRSLSADVLLRRLVETRMRLVRSDQYRSFLANPDPSGANAAEYVFRTVASPAPRARASTGGSGGSDAILVALVVAGSVVLVGGAVVAWAHS